jgi:hypothetical protein
VAQANKKAQDRTRCCAQSLQHKQAPADTVPEHVREWRRGCTQDQSSTDKRPERGKHIAVTVIIAS